MGKLSFYIAILVFQDRETTLVSYFLIHGSTLSRDFSYTRINKKDFGYSFAFDAPTVWNDLPDEVHSV